MKLNEFILLVGEKIKAGLDAVVNVLSQAVAAITKVEDDIKVVEKEIDTVEASIPPSISPDGPAKK